VATSIANKDSLLKDGINHLMLSICLLLLPTCFGFTMAAQDLSFQTYETVKCYVNPGITYLRTSTITFAIALQSPDGYSLTKRRCLLRISANSGPWMFT
jgi:hypothetical protein